MLTDLQLEQLKRAVGGTCRCTPCCCDAGQGHNHPRFEEMADEIERRYPGPREA